MERWLLAKPLFLDRIDAGRRLGEALLDERGPDCVVVGLARGGVQVAAEVARALETPLDVVAVRKVRYPGQPEYALGAVTPGDGVYVRGPDGLTDEQVAQAVATAKDQALELDRRLHARRASISLERKTAILVDDGLATGATMIAAARWAKAAGAGRVVAAVPVAAAESVRLLRREVDDVVTLHAPHRFFAVAVWYGSFSQLDDDDVLQLLDDGARRQEAVPGASRDLVGG
ncbi:MAG: phosphoribosyltransferase [Gaiellaceae bacterium]